MSSPFVVFYTAADICCQTNVFFSAEVRGTAAASCITFAILSKPHAKQKQADSPSLKWNFICPPNFLFFFLFFSFTKK